MRILYISPYPPARDGIGEYTHAIVRSVRDAGNDARIVTPFATDVNDRDVIGPLSSSLRASSFMHLSREVTSWNPDIVHVQFAIAAFGLRTKTLIRLVDRLRQDVGVPIIVTLHDLTREIPLLGPIARRIHRRIAERSTKMIVHTSIACNALAREIGVPHSKISLSPFPILPRPLATVSPANLATRFGILGSRVILAFGFIHIDKGISDLIEALRMLRTTRPVNLDDVRIVIAGSVRPRYGVFRAIEARDQIYHRYLLNRIKAARLEEVMVLTGYVPEGEVGPWFDLAEAVVLPYRRIQQSGVASLACSLGVPVLASTAGGLAEQLEGDPWAFPPRDPERLARTIAEFLTAMPAQRSAWNKPAGAMAPEDAMKLLLDLYESSKKGRHRP